MKTTSGTGAPGRFTVFLFQKSLERSRLTGFMKMRTLVAGLVDGLGPDDYAAVLSFDSRLRPHMDFTSDRARLRYVLLNKVLREWPPTRWSPALPRRSSRASRPAGGRRTRRRRRRPCSSSVVRSSPCPARSRSCGSGWGLGSLGGGFFSMDHDYDEARQALGRSRTSVFALDVTEADAHTLELGLQQVAEDTGGFYERAYTTPIAAVNRIAHAISGYYVLSFDKPPGRSGTHKVNVSLVGRKGTVLARNGYVD